jgi:hypothetical protein
MTEYERDELLKKWELDKLLQIRQESTLQNSWNSGRESQFGDPMSQIMSAVEEESSETQVMGGLTVRDHERSAPRHSFMMKRPRHTP